MKLSNLFLANAIVAIIFGVGFLLIPDKVLGFYALATNEAGILLTQLYGAALVGYAIITWFARSASAEMQRNLVLSLLVTFAVGTVIIVLAELRGVANGLGWVNVVIFVVFTLGYGYFYFMKPKS
jgi:hypothetical protein